MLALPEGDGNGDGAEVESPRLHEREIVVGPPGRTLGDRLLQRFGKRLESLLVLQTGNVFLG